MQRSSWPVTAANMKILKRMQIWMKIWFPVLFRWTRPSHHLLISVSASFCAIPAALSSEFMPMYHQDIMRILWWLLLGWGVLVWLTCAFFRWGCWCCPPSANAGFVYVKSALFWHANRGTTFALRYQAQLIISFHWTRRAQNSFLYLFLRKMIEKKKCKPK